MKKLIFIVSLFIVFLLAGCDGSSPLLSGYAYGDFIYLSCATTEKVEKILIEKGDSIKAGQPLMVMEAYQADNALRIADKNYQAEMATLHNLETGERTEELNIIYSQLRRAQSAADLAKSQLERYRPLYQQKTVSKAEWEQWQDNYRQRQAEVNQLEHQLEAKKLPARKAQIEAQKLRTQAAKLQLDKALWDRQQLIITAPQDAQVYDILYRPGERPTAGKPLVSLLPPDRLKIRFFIPEKYAGAFHTGTRVKIHCDGCPQPVNASINYISPQVEYTPPVIYSTARRETLMFMAEALPESFVRPGQPVRVELAYE